MRASSGKAAAGGFDGHNSLFDPVSHGGEHTMPQSAINPL
jgi:hypothetical protein